MRVEPRLEVRVEEGLPCVAYVIRLVLFVSREPNRTRNALPFNSLHFTSRPAALTAWKLSIQRPLLYSLPVYVYHGKETLRNAFFRSMLNNRVSLGLCVLSLTQQSVNPTAFRRLVREIRQLQTEPPEGIRISTDDEDILDVTGIIQGPGTFALPLLSTCTKFRLTPPLNRCSIGCASPRVRALTDRPRVCS